MARKKRRGGMSGWRKIARKAASFIGSAVIIFGVSHGAISTGQKALASGNFGAIPRDLAYSYTGFDPQEGKFDQNQAIRSIGTILAAVAAGMLIRWGARRV